MPTATHNRIVNPGALLLRETEAAIVLGVSPSQVGIWRRAGLLHVVRVPGIRAARYWKGEVEALAARWAADAGAIDATHGACEVVESRRP